MWAVLLPSYSCFQKMRRTVVTTASDCHEHVIIADKLLTQRLAFSSRLMDSWDLPLVTKPLLLAVSKAGAPRRERKASKGWSGAGDHRREAGPHQGCFPRTSSPPPRLSFAFCGGQPFRVSYFYSGLLGNGKTVLLFYFRAVHRPFEITSKSFSYEQWDLKKSFKEIHWGNTRGK